MKHQFEFVRIAEQLQQERAAARPILEFIRRNPAVYADDKLPQHWRTLGMVGELAEAARELVQQAPGDSLSMARLAIAIARDLDPSYPRVMRAQFTAAAWKELANAHRYRSEYDAALHALDRADAEIRNESALGYDNAVLALARATTLRELDRLPEALTLLDDATEVFREHADSTRVAQCNLLAGMIRHKQGYPLAARQAYRIAVTEAQAAGDARTVASAYLNLGMLDAEAGRTNGALDALQQARAIFKELGAQGEIARATWGVGAALLTAGKYEGAVPVLRDARRAFQSLQMPEEAGLAGVELAEAFIALRKTDEARAVVEEVIEEFRRASLNERALVALAYLRDLGPATRREVVQHVYTYLSRLRREPALLFCPLDEQ
jgi:tetratricopeptide (TPR) repeat protein